MAAASDNAVKPPTFKGTSEEDADAFLKQFERYTAFKEIADNGKKLNLLSVLLSGPAGDWLDTLPAANKDTYGHLIAAFKARYQSPDAIKMKAAKDIFGKKQGLDEAADDYVTRMRKAAALIEIGPNEPALLYAIINGLKPAIQAQVTLKQPATIDAALAAARLAELTVSTTEDSTACQLEAMRKEIKQLTSQMARSNVATVGPRSRSPTPTRQVSFADQPSSIRYGPNRLSYGNNQPAQPHLQQQRRQYSCSRCATYHSLPSECPALGKICHYCHRPNHLQRCCRSAMRGRSHGRPLNYQSLNPPNPGEQFYSPKYNQNYNPNFQF